MNTPSNNSRNASNALVTRLYRLAEKLERDWSNAGLSDDFGSNIVTSVVKHLEKVGRVRPDGTRRDETEQVEFAISLVRKYWAMGARRDAARRKARIEAGKEVETIPLDLTSESAAMVTFECQLRAYHQDPDPLGGDTGREAAAILQQHGWPRERAWAFVLHHVHGKDSAEVRSLMAERFDADLTFERLRVWNCRYWSKGRAILTACLTADATAG